MDKLKCKSLILIICMLLLSFAVGAYAENEENDTVTEKSRVLYDIGIFADEIKPENFTKEVTRVEVAKIISRMLGMPEESASFDMTFTDIHPMSDGAGAIGNVYGLGIMNGFGNEFRPEDKIKESEAIKTLVVSTGYGYNAENSGGYPLGYISIAEKLGISRGIDINSDNYLTYEKLIRFLFNTIDVDIQKRIINGNNYDYITETGKTVLSEYLDIYYIKGCVIQNCYTGLVEAVGLGDGKVKINSGYEEIYNTGTTDASKYLGCSVKAYVKENNVSGEKTILNISNDKNKTDVVIVDCDDLVTVVPEASVSYYNSLKTETLKISQTANIIYNNIFYDKAYNVSEEIFRSDYGTDTFIDSDGDGVYETIIISDKKIVYVKSVNSEEGRIYGKNDEFYDLQASDVQTFTIYKDGSIASEKNINSDDILEIMESENSTVYVVNIIADKQNGKLTSVGENTVEIDGKAYDAIKNAITADFKVGAEGTFFFNDVGKLIYGDINGASSNEKYGILIALSRNESDESKLIVRLFTSESKEEIYQTDTKITLDGIKSSSSETIKKLRQGDKVVRRLIKYKLNSKNEITFIDTSDRTSKEDDDSLSLDIEKSNMRYYSTGTFYPDHGGFGKCMIDGKTKIFMVGNTLDGDTSGFSAASMNNMVSTADYDVEIYDIDEEHSLTSGAIVVYTEETAKSDSKLFVVESIISRVSNENDDEIVTGLIGGYQSSINSSMWYKNDNKDMQSIEGESIKEGDVLQIIKSGTEIKNATRLVGAATPYGIKVNNALVSLYGIIISMDKQSGVSVVNIGTDAEPETVVVPISGMSGYKYDTKEKKVSIASMDDAEPETKLFVRYRYNDPQEYVIIK